MNNTPLNPKPMGIISQITINFIRNFIRQSEQLKRSRAPTKCKPFLLHTSLIQSKKDHILDDIRTEEEMRYLQSFQIKGKQLPIKSASGMNLSANLQRSEPIPTKTTDVQRAREVIARRKRREGEIKSKFEEKFQRSRSAKEKRLKEKIHERAKLTDKSAVYKAKKEENVIFSPSSSLIQYFSLFFQTRRIRQSLHRQEDDYARQLDDINDRVDRRPLLLEERQRDRAVRDLERNIKHAMRVAKITEKDLMRQKFNPPNVKVTASRTNYSS